MAQGPVAFYGAAEMESNTAQLPKPLPCEAKRRPWGRLAEGAAQAPWSGRTGAVGVVIAFAGFLGLPELFAAAARHGLPDFNSFWPNLVWGLPMLGALVYLSRQSGTTVGAVFGLRGAPVGWVLLSGLLLHLLELALAVVVTLALTRLGFSEGAADTGEASAAAGSWTVFINDSVWAPTGEELWFRGLLYTSLRCRLRIAPAAIITAALFSLIHYPETVQRAAILFIPAILSSLWYERTRSLWPNLLSHSLHNTLVTVFHGGG